MVNTYPKKFFSMLNKDAKKRENPLMTKANCYITSESWKKLPNTSKIRYFKWLLEQGEIDNKPVPEEKALLKLKNFFYMNYEIYKTVVGGISSYKQKVYLIQMYLFLLNTVLPII